MMMVVEMMMMVMEMMMMTIITTTIIIIINIINSRFGADTHRTDTIKPKINIRGDYK